jgi:hypothetical protein
MRMFDWLFRTAMLALAGLVTLSMLASIAAISTESGPRGWVGGERAVVEPAAEPDPGQAREGTREAAGEAVPDAGEAGENAAAATRPEPGRWLEAIVYALLALAGLLTIALLVLAGAARDLRRIADSLSGRPR